MSRTSFLLVFIVAACTWGEIGSAHAAPLYKVYGKRGVVTFTSKRPKSGRYTRIKTKKPLYSRIIRRRGYYSYKAVKSRYDGLILSAANSFKLEPALVKAVVHAESSFNPQATSHKGAMGLMQLMPGTADMLGVKNAYKPNENLQGGARYLRQLLDRYKGNIQFALAAYNAGENAVDRYSGIPPYAETRNYVKRVEKLLQIYRSDNGSS